MLRAFEKWLDPSRLTKCRRHLTAWHGFSGPVREGHAVTFLRLLCCVPACRFTKPGCFPSSGRSWICCPLKAGGDTAAQESSVLWGIGLVLLSSIVLVALRTMVQHRVLAINLPLRLRWDFHRLMLRQSLSFSPMSSPAASPPR